MSKLIFHDEFNALSLYNGSGGTWQPSYDWAPNGLNVGTSWLVNPLWGPTSAANANPYSISNGVLSIGIMPTPQSVLASVQNTPFLSGQLETKPTFSQLYGYFEMNAELPAAPGLNSAFWLLPVDGSWPPELDVEEVLGNDPTTLVMTAHSQIASAGPHWTTIPDASQGFHTYAVDWEANTITWYFDGRQVAQEATPADMHKPMYVLVDTLSGTPGSWEGGPVAGETAQMKVNYIRTCDSNPYVNGVNTVAIPGDPPPVTPPVTPPVPPAVPPAPVTTGTGSDTMVLAISEDAYQGDAQFTVSLDGKQLGGTFTTTASHAAGVSQSFTFKGDWAIGAHPVVVNFLNDAWGGSSATDRNLYVNAISYDGTATGQSTELAGTGPQSFSVTDTTAIPATPPVTPPAPPAGVTTGSGSDTMVLSISEDAYQGDAQFTVSVDGKQLGGTFTTTVSHAAGVSQSFTFKGDWAIGAHPVAVNFLNDAWGGTAATDRNLYVNAISYDGTATGQSAELAVPGPQSFSVTDGTAIPVTPPVTPPAAPVPSPDGTKITTASASPIIDQAGKKWTLVQSASNGLQIAVNGAVDATTANVVLLETLGGKIVCENTGGNWYSELAAGGAWAQITAPVTPPIVVTPPVTPPAAAITTGSGSDTLVLGIAEDAYQGDAQFTVSVDGKQLAGTFAATASHAAGASQSFIFKGDWAPGAHAVAINFLNDLYGGTAAADRNLYVNAISYDGTATGQSRALTGPGPQGFSVTDNTAIPIPAIGSGSDALVLKVSEDAYQGDPQFTVSVDGRQLGGTLTATSSHAAGQDQILTFKGDFGTGSHAVSVNFLNDLWVANVGDRNLYVDGITYGGTATGQTGQLLGTGPMGFAVSGGTTPSVSETGDHGSLAKNLAQTGSYTVGGDTFVLTAGNAAAVTLGTGAAAIKFIGASAVTLTAGSGQASVTADAGNNKFVAGSGTLDVTGGGGKDAYVFHANGGLLKLEDFSAAKGDTLTVDKALQGSMLQASDGQGGTMLGFGAGAGHGVDIHGLAAMPATSIV